MLSFYIIIGVIMLCGILLLALGVVETRVDTPETATSRLNRIRGPQRRSNLPEIDKEFVRREEQRAVSARKSDHLPALSTLISRQAILADLEEKLVQARSPWRASELLYFSVMVALAELSALTWFVSIWVAIPVALAALCLPWLYVHIARTTYYRKFDEQLADSLMLVANSLKAGFSFMQSMEMLAREAPFPISDEFHRVTQEIALGIPIIEALNNMTTRVKSMDLQLLVTAVGIQYEVGGTLADILETIANVIHERIRIKGEIRVLTTQGRWSGGFLCALPILLGLGLHFVSVGSDPDGKSFITPLLTEQLGWLMLGCAGFLQLLGIFAIMKIVSIRV